MSSQNVHETNEEKKLLKSFILEVFSLNLHDFLSDHLIFLFVC